MTSFHDFVSILQWTNGTSSQSKRSFTLYSVISEEGRKGQRTPLHGFSNVPGAKIFVLFVKTLLFLLEQDPHTQTSLIHLVKLPSYFCSNIGEYVCFYGRVSVPKLMFIP